MNLSRIAIILLVALFFSILYLFIMQNSSNVKNIKSLPISLPEEISQVKDGDTLYVTNVSDSIYIGFKIK